MMRNELPTANLMEREERPAVDLAALWSGPVPTLADVYRARNVIRPHLTPTPLLEPVGLAARLGCEIFVKCENLQPTGAFKVRGGINLMSRLPEAERVRGVVAASTGNHGQSIAYAARMFGAKAIVFVPERPNELKVQAMERLGATIIREGTDFDDCFVASRQYAHDHDLHWVHSANEPDLIAGVATATLEIMEAVPDLEVIFVPIGGGSGLCGACVVGKAINPALQVIGVQAEGAPAAYESWRRRELLALDTADTFAEGVATRSAYELPARILWDNVDDIMLVSDAEMRRAILTLLETTRMLAEGAGAAALAGVYKRRAELVGKKVAVMLSGGNLTLETLAQALSEERPW
jgi:threonine dehydratase